MNRENKRGTNINLVRIVNLDLRINCFLYVNYRIMRARHISYQLIATFLVFGVAQISYSQEYDDLYFTSKDRKVLKLADETTKGQATTSQATIESFTNEAYTEDYSAKNVNPEYIARYQSQAAQGDNPAYGTFAETEEVEYYTEEEIANSQPPTIVNNYYGSTPYRYQPNRWAFRPSMQFGYNPWMGWQTGFGFSMTYGDPFFNSWANPWMMDPWMMDPFYNPWGWGRPGFAGAGFYDPWFDPFFCPPGYGFSRFPRRNNAYLVGYYNGFYAGGGGRVVVVGDTRPRQYVSGARYGRGGLVTGVSRSVATSTATRGRTTTTPSTSITSQERTAVNRGRVTRNYGRTQNEYYNRSRSRVSSNSSSNGRAASTNVRTGTSRSYRSTATQSSYQNRSRSRASSSSVQSLGRSTAPSRSNSQSINRSSNSSRRYSTSGSSSNSNNRTYRSNSSSGRSNRVFSQPSRSNRSGSYNRSSTPSRSRSYTPSRSSGGRSSGGSIRSSGGSGRSVSPSRSSGSRSSGSRSSGSRSSSGRSRGRN